VTRFRIRLLIGMAAALALPAAAPPASSTAAGFGASSFDASVSTTVAGAHPDAVVGWEMNTDGEYAPGMPLPVGTLKDAEVDLPPGLVGNPRATGRCTASQLSRAACPRESLIGALTFGATGIGRVERTPVWNMEAGSDRIADFAADPFGGGQFTIHAVPFVRSNGDYGLRVSSRNISSLAPVTDIRYEFFGVPADHAGLDPAYAGTIAPNSRVDDVPLVGAPRHPFLTNPSRCGEADTAVLRLRSHQAPEGFTASAAATLPRLTDCDSQPFAPSIDVAPDTRQAGAPSGYRVVVKVPNDDTPAGRSTANVDDARVALPAGVAISPTVAGGLEACTDEQLATGSTDAERCPSASRIGRVRIETPVLELPLEGRLYLGAQQSQDPTSGEMYRIFATAYAQGVRLKLEGRIKADPRTGQLTATFRDNPQLPFSALTLEFKGGPRAPLVNPGTCGTKTTTAVVGSWGGHVRDVSSSFAVDQGCPQGGFSPGFTAGTLQPFAGRFSPFTMTATRPDGDQDLSRIALDLPSGLLGALGTVPVCADAQAAAGTCGAESRLGSTTIAVGTGSNPFGLGGTVSLAGPYKGAPFSLSIAVPAKAGPLDLGMVVVRSPLIIDANRAKVSAPVDELPQIVGGVPLHYRSISVTLDRPGFMWNATSCAPSVVGATLTTVGGAVATPSARYQAQGCDKLKLDPKLALRWAGKGELKKGKHPAIEADLTDTFGHANLKSVAVTLPLTASLDPDNAKALCEAAGAAARSCPEASIVGRASATTTALHEPLTGPVYFVKGTRRTASGKIAKTTPKLYLKLRGDGVDVDLHVDSSVKDKRLVATFRDIPDVPLQDFKLRLNGGKGGPIVATNDPCAAEKSTAVVFRGQNGAVTRRTLRFTAPACKPAVSAAVGTASRVTVRVGGIGPGRLSISGPQVRSASTKITSADAAQVTGGTRLTAAQKRLLSQGRSIKVAVRVTFKPKSGKSITFKRTVTIKGVKRSSGS
jgi:hypothetical protein